MGVPIKYRKGASAIASYDFIDLATGRGMTTFYGGDLSGAHSGANTSYILTSYPFYSTIGSTGGSTTPQDVDFDVILEQPFILDGECTINIPIMTWNETGGTVIEYRDVRGIIYKVVGGTPTELTSGASTCMGVTGATAGKNEVACIKCNIPRTKFRAGDTLRLKVQTTGQAGAHHTSIAHDPMNRFTIVADAHQIISATGAWTQSTQLTMHIPIVIDL